ncbi:MAG: hypothetical protein ACREJD_16215 [Phycisphaerales bacterium]
MRSIRAFLVLSGPLFVLPNLSDATTLNQAQVFVAPDFSGGSGPFSQTISQSGPIDLAGSATGGFNSSGQASMHVHYGLIRGQGSALVSLNAAFNGIFRDEIIVTSPGVPNGTQGTLTYSVIASGTVTSLSGASGATWQVRTDVGGGAYDIGKSGTQFSPDLFPGGYSGDPIGTYSVSVSFQFGLSMPLQVELSCNADAANSGNGHTGQANFGAPFMLRWGGISSVKLNGTPVTFSVSSATGTNWSDAAAAPCSGDLNGDSQVDDSDFVLFVAAYNILDCADPAMPAGCPSDLTNDGVVDDSDFVQFVAAYNDLICP